MQTFLPYPDLAVSCQVLDGQRLGKQRVETFQVLRALTWPEYAWKNHPAVRMWRGFVPGLVAYGVASCREWTRRGNADAVLPQLLGWTGGEVPVDPQLPPWFGLDALHRSHRSSLLRKDPAYYRPLFGPDEPDDLPYFWPPDTWPRWPVRRGDRDLDLAGALAELGLAAPRTGQAEAVAAARAGRDCLLVARPGWGGPTAGLLAALTRPGTTRWVRPADGPASDRAPEVGLLAPRELPAAGPGAGSRPPPLARAPSPVDLLAMRAEAAPPEVVFGRAVEPLPEGCTLVVLEHADQLAAGGLRVPPGGPPVLAVVPAAGPAERDRLCARLGLRDPVLAGGGWDLPATWLGVRAAAAPAAARTALCELVGTGGPALVAVRDRGRVDRVVVGLRGAGLRVGGWYPQMRASRAAEAVGAWRRRRLDALVVTGTDRPPLGRTRVRLLVTADAPADRRDWRDAVAAVDPERAVLLVLPADGTDVRELAAARGCRRALLLAPLGEPVAVPCGACDRCCC